MEPRDSELLTKVLERLEVKEWDLLLVGDGSGTNWNEACGWCATLIDRQTGGRRLFYGSMNLGSNNAAEIMPYVQALTWFHAVYGKERLDEKVSLKVVVITDSQHIATQGNAVAGLAGMPSKNSILFAPFAEMSRLGYMMEFRWAPRATTDLNKLADLIAGLSRRELLNIYKPCSTHGLELIDAAERALARLTFEPARKLGADLYRINPSG